VHQTIKDREGLARTHAKLARTVVEHHRHAVELYDFVRETLAATQPPARQEEAVGHVREMEACADCLELLEPRLEPSVRVALYLYWNEVAKVARVVRQEVDSLETTTDRLDASLEAVLRALEVFAESQIAVDNRHSDTAV